MENDELIDNRGVRLDWTKDEDYGEIVIFEDKKEAKGYALIVLRVEGMNIKQVQVWKNNDWYYINSFPKSIIPAILWAESIAINLDKIELISSGDNGYEVEGYSGGF